MDEHSVCLPYPYQCFRTVFTIVSNLKYSDLAVEKLYALLWEVSYILRTVFLRLGTLLVLLPKSYCLRDSISVSRRL